MKNKISLLFAIIATTVTAGCQKQIEAVEQESMVVSIVTSLDTRSQSSPFEGTDLSLSLNYGSALYDQIGVEWNKVNNEWSYSTQMLWLDFQTPLTICAFAPYTNEYPSASEFVFTANENQSTDSSFAASGLYGCNIDNYIPTQNSALELTLERKMALLDITFDDNSEEVISLTISGLYLSVTYDVESGIATLDTSEGTKSCEAYLSGSNNFQLHIAPQTINANNDLMVNYATNYHTYSADFSSTATLQSGDVLSVKIQN